MWGKVSAGNLRYSVEIASITSWGKMGSAFCYVSGNVKFIVVKVFVSV